MVAAVTCGVGPPRMVLGRRSATLLGTLGRCGRVPGRHTSWRAEHDVLDPNTALVPELRRQSRGECNDRQRGSGRRAARGCRWGGRPARCTHASLGVVFQVEQRDAHVLDVLPSAIVRREQAREGSESGEDVARQPSRPRTRGLTRALLNWEALIGGVGDLGILTPDHPHTSVVRPPRGLHCHGLRAVRGRVADEKDRVRRASVE